MTDEAKSQETPVSDRVDHIIVRWGIPLLLVWTLAYLAWQAFIR